MIGFSLTPLTRGVKVNGLQTSFESIFMEDAITGKEHESTSFLANLYNMGCITIHQAVGKNSGEQYTMYSQKCESLIAQ